MLNLLPILVQFPWIISKRFLLFFRVYLVNLAIYYTTPQSWCDPRRVPNEVRYMFRILSEFWHDLDGRTAIPYHGNFLL